MKKYLPVIASLIAVVLFCIAGIRQEGRQAVRHALDLCINGLIPAVFPSLCISEYLMVSGLWRRIRIPFVADLFGLPPSSSSAVLLGFICGFPTAAILAQSMYEKGAVNEKEGRDICIFCSMPSLSFTVGYVGGELLKSVWLGAALYAVTLFSSILLGVLLSLFRERRASLNTEKDTEEPKLLSAVVPSVRRAVPKLANVCAFVIFFSVVASALIKVDRNAEAVLLSFLEITAGTKALVFSHVETSLVLMSASLGFSGVSVMCQIFACAPSIPLGKYFPAKLINSFISAITSAALITLPPVLFATVIFAVLTAVFVICKKRSLAALEKSVDTREHKQNTETALKKTFRKLSDKQRSKKTCESAYRTYQ